MDWSQNLRDAERQVNAARSGDLEGRLECIRRAQENLRAAEKGIKEDMGNG